MSRQGRKNKKKRRKEAKEREALFRDILSLKISPHKRNKEDDIEKFFCSENFYIHRRHPLFHVFKWNKDRVRYIERLNEDHREALRELLWRAFDLEMMNCAEYAESLLGICQYSDLYIRPIKDWNPSTHNRDRQFSSLLRHLFVYYDMPQFMDSVWYDSQSANWRLLYLEIGSGMSVYKAIKHTGLTRKMSHYFMRAPNSISVRQAVRWAQVMGFGGDERMAHAVIHTDIVNSQYNEFWSSVVHLLARNPLMDMSQVGPIIDYIQNQILLDTTFSMKGRTIDSLLKKAERWHRDLHRSKKVSRDFWEGIHLPDWHIIHGKKNESEAPEEQLGKNQTLYTISQITTGKELAEEGRELNHCVYAYTNACKSGRTSIWAMRKKQWNKEQQNRVEKRLLTIEVDNQNRRIVQVRGCNNRLANPQEKEIIYKWASESKLRVAAYGM